MRIRNRISWRIWPWETFKGRDLGSQLRWFVSTDPLASVSLAGVLLCVALSWGQEGM